MEIYKILMIIPAILLIFSLIEISDNFAKYGSFMQKDVELTGGLSITISTPNDVDIKKIENTLPGSAVRTAKGYEGNLVIIQTKELDEKKVLDILKGIIEFQEKDVEIGRIEPAIGDIFWSQAQIAMAMTFVLMAIVVLIMFRSLVPSMMVIFCALADMIMTIATISLLDVKLSFPVFAGLIMLIGYSVDTDILLTTRVLKGTEELKEKINSSIKTGLTMTTTSLVAALCLFIFSQGSILREIGLVLIIGLIFDMVNTWITNVGLLTFWIEHKEKKKDD